MQTDFTTLVDTLYGTTTTPSEIPNTIQILQPNPNETTAKQPKAKTIDWKILVSVGIAIVLLCVIYFLWNSSVHAPTAAARQQQQQQAYIATSSSQQIEEVEAVPQLPHQELLRAIEAVPRLSKPETFHITGEIPTSDDIADDVNSNSQNKLSSDGSDMQEYIRRREAVTKTLESHQ